MGMLRLLGSIEEEGWMQLHQRGVDLLLNVMDAAEHVEKLSHDEMHRILEEVAEVLGELLERDVPSHAKERAAPMAKEPHSDREKVARALCRFRHLSEGMKFRGKPMWMDFLPEANAVLEAIGWNGDDEPEGHA
jgi:hypothetical protein